MLFRTKTAPHRTKTEPVYSTLFSRFPYFCFKPKTKNAMKPMFYSLFALCFLMPTYAQTVDFIKELEPAILQCTYRCTMKLDTLGTNTKTDRMILRIGKNISQFYSYTAYRTDSIWKTPNGKRIWGNAMVRAIRSKNHAQMLNANMVTNDYIYKNYPEGKLSTYAQLGVTSVRIEEDYTGQDWTLQDSNKTLLGYPCQLATCSFRRRDYQAWFTSDIPIANGPWKFKGLPGLILEVYDTQCHYQFRIEGIERTNIAPVCFYYTLPDPRTAERTDRIRYLQLKEEGTAGVPGFIQKTGLSGGKKKDRQKMPKGNASPTTIWKPIITHTKKLF
ncbi:hypothetical protein B5F25_07585 [Bacteroides sp. An19]|nr:hypothetical protein B5F25_07585 [Bacteroides sp. An19]